MVILTNEFMIQAYFEHFVFKFEGLAPIDFDEMLIFDELKGDWIISDG